MNLIQGLPLLTSDEHEFTESIDCTDPPDDRPGWTLIGYVGGVAASERSYEAMRTALLWARRKDGLPLGSLPRDCPRKQPPRRCKDDV